MFRTGENFLRRIPNLSRLEKKVVVVIGKGDRVNTLDPLRITSIEEKLAHT